MKRKIYEKPSAEVVKLRQQNIICSSPGQAGVQDYTFETEAPE